MAALCRPEAGSLGSPARQSLSDARDAFGTGPGVHGRSQLAWGALEHTKLDTLMLLPTAPRPSESQVHELISPLVERQKDETVR